MPRNTMIARVKKAKRRGRALSIQAGEFVREELRHIRGGKRGARLAKQAIAIGLSKARRAGIKLPPKSTGLRSPSTHPRPQSRLSARKATRARQRRYP